MTLKNVKFMGFVGCLLWSLFFIIAKNCQSSPISINHHTQRSYTFLHPINTLGIQPLTWIFRIDRTTHYDNCGGFLKKNPKINEDGSYYRISAKLDELEGNNHDRLSNSYGKLKNVTEVPKDNGPAVAEIVNQIVEEDMESLPDDITHNNFGDRSNGDVRMSYKRANRSKRPVMKKKLTMADVINKNMMIQPPPKRVTEELMSRKPWKRLEISKLIKKEKEKIKNDTTFLDGYFYKYLESKGQSKFSGVFKKNINDNNSYKFDIQELLNIWNSKISYFYMNISKTVAILDIIKEITESSNITPEIFESVNEHTFFFRTLKSLLKHVSYLNKIRVSNHLSNDVDVLKHIPTFTPEQMTLVFSSLAYFKPKRYALLERLLNYVKVKIDAYTYKQLDSILKSCMELDYNADIIVKDYISKVCIMLKSSKGDDKTTNQAFDKQDILSVLSICSRNDYMDGDLLSILANKVKEMDDLGVDDASNFIRYFSLSHHIDESLFDKLYCIICSNKNSLNKGMDIFNLVCSITECHAPPPSELMDYIMAQVLKRTSEYTLTQLTILLKSFAMLGYYNDQLFRKVFELPIFSNPPKPQVMEQIRLGLNKNSSYYSAYLSPNQTSLIDVLFSNVHSAYLGYSLEYKKGTFKLSDEALENIKKIPTRLHRFSNINSSGLHLDISSLLKEFFSINCFIEYVTESGLIVDLAILPESLSIPAKDIEFVRDKRCSIEIHGPFHYLQKSTNVFPPPMNNKTLYKQRLLRSSGWDTKYLNYWDYVPWMKKEHKLRVLTNLLPNWIKTICDIK